jgi:hypothetical protein
MRYWKRLVTPMPLRIGAVFRQTDEGAWQRWNGDDWLTVPGKSFAALAEGDTMVDRITEVEALALTRRRAGRGG